MLKGLDRFKNHFASYPNSYSLIGGTTCSLAMREAGLDFRATKDLDIVLCLESLQPNFGQAVWEFVKQGQYETKQKSSGKTYFTDFILLQILLIQVCWNFSLANQIQL
ncbi:MAG TPA: hypothetical protein DCE71_08505 [Parachlamydiales bacterium]|nr:hypothetical protein [Parachlamydiales bacterium]